MLQKVKWAYHREYRSGTEDEPFQFYVDALCNSTRFDILLGYFSSSAINILAPAFANFLYRGGIVRLVINNFLSKQDKDAVEKGLTGSVPSSLLRINDLRELERGLDEYGTHFFNCISWLISQNKIEIKIISPKNKIGMAHYKLGIFSDGVDDIAYESSCNFTAHGLVENLEQLTCYLKWDDERSRNKINNIKEYFEDIFSGKADFIHYHEISEVEEVIKNKFGDRALEELLINGSQLLRKRKKFVFNKRVQESLEEAEKNLKAYEEELNRPRFPYKTGPREYQQKALKSWLENDSQGVFAMATGTGKTITALNCLLEDYKSKGKYQAVIIVPTIALTSQWKNECKKFNFDNVIIINSRNKWENEVSFFNTASKLLDVSYVIIVTYASFYRKKFFSHFKNLPKDALLIADEAHNLGAPKVSKILPSVHLRKRIGLSATPDRKYDDLGNQTINKFFNDAPPYCYSFSMEEAIKGGFLCKYKYYPILVELNEVELKEYIKKSKQLLRYFDPQTNKYKDCIEVEQLLLQRKRIIHKAENKIDAFEKIVKTEFQNRGNLKYTLVYVPEGIEPNYERIDFSTEDEEEIRLINKYTRLVSIMDSSIMVKQFTGGTPNRDQVLQKFENGEIHVLTSMKCLDEGVDVPRSELAIFCSSTGNPRQFIQRRGRILRNHPDKTHATIYDLVVFPGIESGENSLYNMERNLFRSELERVKDFSTMAINSSETYEALKPALDYFNLSLYNV